jgi:homoserine kinase
MRPGVPNVYARKLPYSDKIKAVVAIPNFEVSTEKARQALPPTYSRADVVRRSQIGEGSSWEGGRDDV